MITGFSLGCLCDGLILLSLDYVPLQNQGRLSHVVGIMTSLLLEGSVHGRVDGGHGDFESQVVAPLVLSV